ncbi:aldehyde dehydrogenase family protein [Saccharopolyspora phatthalungensis]|uniref:Aldehyde dehydrogenase (NAD+) n=1 Tax=Saccharopolyspora phatthalungensis TaxID=664693 RepID=A0A840QBZ3_9PSEU|nr:aldehyde dehydrogenase family protein [Saccharopolyspora phatthalungensis]MBB5157331.1 aldehyde dehydrogenase (NAD+) [Saccharopolyspora phatthalungensis]
MASPAVALQTTLGGLWGSREPDEALLNLVEKGRPGSPFLLVDGKLREATSGAHFDNVNPTTEQVMGTTADAGPEDVEAAVAAARRAFDETDWSTNHSFRRRCLEQLHLGLVKVADELRATATREIGVGIRTTYGFHSDFALDLLPWWAQYATNYDYEVPLPDQPWAAGNNRIIAKEPLGVIAAITPWNYPLYTTMTKIGPALAAGNTTILKPAPQTPWHATLIAKVVAEETDIPPGVLNILPTSDNSVAELLTTDPRVDMVHFTGSTAVGKKIIRNTADRIGRVALELGGKSANIVLDDAPITDLIPIAAGLVCMNSGQGCVLPTRLLVPHDRYEESVELATFAYENIPYGDPREPHVIQGPQVSQVQRERVLSYIEKGRAEGATVLAGGGTPAHLETGYFVEPTLFADVDPRSTIAQEEIFGPVLCLMPYRDEDHAVQIANDTSYGLAGSVWSATSERAVAVARRIRSGMLSVNGGFFYARDLPVGGYKQSGLGRECGVEGFEEFLETKAIAIGVS